MDRQDTYDLDEWKTFILKVLVEKNDGSLTDYVWNRLKQEFHLGIDERNGHYLYTECVLPCLENEFNLIRLSGARGIQITEKGKSVAQKGFRSYLDSLKRHDTLHRVNDYLSTAAAILSIISVLLSSANLLCGWIDKYVAFIPSVLLLVLFITFRWLCKSKVD